MFAQVAVARNLLTFALVKLSACPALPRKFRVEDEVPWLPNTVALPNVSG